MPTLEVLFRVKYECPFLEMTEKNPNLSLYAWCNGTYDIMELNTKTLEEYESVMGEIRKSGKIIEEIKRNDTTHLIVSTCFCTPLNSVPLNVNDLRVIVIPPDITQNGWTYYRTIVFGQEDFAAIVNRLTERGFGLEILKMINITDSVSGSMLTTDDIFSSLTSKQLNAVLTAYKYGYFKVPRVDDIQSIADNEMVKRTTFQNHLRKGVNKIIESLTPYMQLYKTKDILEENLDSVE
jgi:predicted DNA binding protein